MNNFSSLWNQLMNEEIFIDDIIMYKDTFQKFAFKVLSEKISPDDPELEAFIKICNDVYTYSLDGEVMIPDSLYDQCMNIYKSNGKGMIIYADSIGKKKWNFIKHEIPGVVGSLGKIYNYKELKDYLSRYNGVESYVLAPKYDGISCAIKIKNGKIISAATRYDGIVGQDITELIKRAKNSENFIFPEFKNGYYKCELAMATEDYEELILNKKYANRRSATAGVINTPSNLNFAKYITIIPLLFYDDILKDIYYLAPYQERVQFYSPSDLMDDIENMLEKIRSKDFPFRVDGVVINPDRSKLGPPNEFDLMDNSIAFKVNTAEGKTKIKYGYMSIGRLGKGVPMLKVYPVEVNETIVEDVSLGSYDKFLSMNLQEGEEIIVYSAGDVIPQVKLPAIRSKIYDLPDLKIKRICPYCNEKLTRVNSEYFCTNSNCPRIITGKIANFCIKMGMEGFSDKSVEMIYNKLGIKSIHDFLNLTIDDIMTVDGFDQISANNLYTQCQQIKKTPVPISQFFGSLGIDKISEKKCRKIFEYVNLNELLSANNKRLEKIFWELQCSDGIGAKTARVFIDYIKNNQENIRELLGDVQLTGNIKYKHNIVFTGFRPDKETEERIHSMGIEISNSVSNSTLAVITASTENQSTKSKAAISKGIPIIHAINLEEYLQEIEKEIN